MNETTADPPAERPLRGSLAALALALLSASVLLLEVGQVRIFSFLLWHHVTYLVVTVTLLGFAVGGTYVAVARRVAPIGRSATASAAFGCACLLGFALLARHRIEALPRTDSRWPALTATFSYLYLVVPFFFAGVGVAAALDGEGRSVSRRYAANLLGSAAGALLATPVLRAFGGPGVVVVAAALALLAAAGFASAAGRRAAVWGLAAVLSLLLLPVGDRVFPFPCAPGKTLDRELKNGATPLHTAWDPIARIDVVGSEERDAELRVYQDGDAPTRIPSAERARSDALLLSYHALGYLLRFDPRTRSSRDKALVIGVGGGIDLATALAMGAQRVVGAEINASTVAMMEGRFRDYSGALYLDPRVEIRLADGRAVVARSQERFDIIQITGADTYAALASGANLVAEAYLYTMEALRDYLDHLEEDGVLCVLRWRFRPARETLRFFGMAARALRERGVEDPSRHLAVIDIDNAAPLADGSTFETHYATTIVKPTPFTDAEVDLLQRFCREHPRAASFRAAYVPGVGGDEEFEDYLEAIASGPDAERAFEASYPYAVDPVSDDRPFFFQFYRGRDVLRQREEERGQSYFRLVIGGGPVGLQVLWFSLSFSSLLVLLLVVGPLLLLRRGGLAVPGAARHVVYFCALGLSYLAVEIATIQRLTLFLGHPLRALAVGLTTFLVGSGLGAAVTSRVARGREAPAARLGLAAVALLLAAHAALLPSLLRATLSASDGARVLVAVAALVPLAFFMGVPFPLGLRLVRAQAAPLLPWAFGVNGAASVVASVAAILLAMDHGFSWVLWAGVLLYALAAVVLSAPRGASTVARAAAPVPVTRRSES